MYELKAYVENIFIRLGINFGRLQYTQVSTDLFSAALNIATRDGKQIAVIGIVAKKVLKGFDIDNDVFYAELNWTLLMKFQPVKRDLALLVDASVPFVEIEKVAYETERKLLKEVYLFDVYEGKNLEAGKKSYAVTFILQDENKTLNDKQIDSIMSRIINNLQQKLNAKLR